MPPNTALGGRARSWFVRLLMHVCPSPIGGLPTTNNLVTDCIRDSNAQELADSVGKIEENNRKTRTFSQPWRMIFLDRFLQGLKPQLDDDVVDRLNYYYTPRIFLIFALTLCAKQYVGQPIQCWIPAQFTGAWEQYSENYCFVQNTYFLPLTHYIPRDIQEREDREIGYYQWVPFVLGLQALLFYLPSLLWKILNWQSGVAVKSIIKMCDDVSNMQIDKRKNSVDVVATHIRDSLRTQQIILKSNPVSLLTRRGSYLNLLYLVIKFIYVVQCALQFIILNRFLSTSYTFWGFEILRDLAYGREWEESGHFPRVTMCDFSVRVLGNIHRHTLQCVLMINMFNEKVYLFVWWWILIVLIATIASFAYWLIMTFSEKQADSFITQYLRVYGVLPNEARGPVNKFIDSYLRHDGIFLLRLIATNAGDLITTDLVYHLWQMFLDEEAPKAQTLPLPRAPPANLDDVDGNNYDEKARLT